MNLADYSEVKNDMLNYVVKLMSDRLLNTVSNYLFAYNDICEIRLRVGVPLAFTISDGNLITGVVCNRDDINTIINRMTGGSYLKNEELMRQGVITLKHGVRVGVCGDVFVSSGEVKVLRSVSYLNIRMPARYITDCSILTEHIVKSEFSSSVLVFSPPCHGKTTYLRSIASVLSSEPFKKRVCVIDTNYELGCQFSKNALFCDFLGGYPKPYGITVAYRYMNPEYVICDELVGIEEANTLLSTQHTGVPLIASTHCDSYSSLFSRKNIKILLQNGVFDTVMRIKRVGKSFSCELKKVSEI